MSGVGIKFTVKRVDHGWDKLFNETIKELSKGDPQVRVGVFASTAERDGEELTNVEIAAIHEFGTEHVPERSFIRSTFNQHRAEYAAMIRKLLPRVVEGKLEPRTMFDIVGQQIVADINKKVRVEGVPPPLADSTIARKGSSRALIDTGRMLAAVTYITEVAGEQAPAGVRA